MFSEDEMLSLPQMSKLFKTQLKSSQLFDHPRQRNRDLELQTQMSSDESSSEEDDGLMRNGTDGTDSVDSDDYLSDNLFDVSSSVCEGIRVFDSINPSLSKSFFSVDINDEKKYICHYFRKIKLLCLQIV